MARYVYSEEALEKKLQRFHEERAAEKEKVELRKRRELMRRKVHATLFAPQVCLGDPMTGAVCTRYAVPGSSLCVEHGGNTKAMQNAAKMRLLCLVEPAMRVLNKAMAGSNMFLALKAAQIILDRAGFHPSATLEITEKPMDLTNLTTEQLKARAARLLQAMNEQPDSEDLPDIEMEEQKPDSIH